MSSNPKLAGIIFDLDGVLADSEPFICEAACRMFLERHGVAVRPEDFLPFVGAGEDRYLGGVAERHGVQLRMPEDKVWTYTLYLELIKGRLQPLPGAVQFIAAARARGLRLAVASSADQMKVAGNLRQIALPPEGFDALVTGNDVERKKPDPQAFLLAAERLRLPPEQCLVVEDAPNGLQAGRAGGFRCLGIATSFSAGDLLAAGADWTAPNLASVPQEALHW